MMPSIRMIDDMCERLRFSTRSNCTDKFLPIDLLALILYHETHKWWQLILPATIKRSGTACNVSFCSAVCERVIMHTLGFALTHSHYLLSSHSAVNVPRCLAQAPRYLTYRVCTAYTLPTASSCRCD